MYFCTKFIKPTIMNKKFLTITAIAVLALGMSLGACKNNRNSDRYDDDEDDIEEVNDDLDDVETVEEADEEDQEADEEEGIYIPTNDMLTFDVNGPVKQIVYKQSGGDVYVYFDEEGDVLRIASKSGDDSMADAEIERDDQGRIVGISWEEEYPWVYRLDYYDDGKVSQQTYTNQMGNYIAYSYHYNVNGHDTTADYEQAVHGEIAEAYEYEIVFSAEDHHDNWTRCTMECQEGGEDLYRSISYHHEGSR